MKKRKKVKTIEDFNKKLGFKYFCTESAKKEFKNKTMVYNANIKNINRTIEVFVNDYLSKKYE